MSEITPNTRTMQDAWLMADALGKILCDTASLFNTADCDHAPAPPEAMRKLRIASNGVRQLIEDLQSGYYEARS